MTSRWWHLLLLTFLAVFNEVFTIDETHCRFDGIYNAPWKECECIPVGKDSTIHVMCKQVAAATVPPLPQVDEELKNENQQPVNILALSLTDGGLKFLQQDSFRSQNIQTLDFTNNQIQTVNVNAFRGLEMKLFKLILTQNNISVIPSWALTYLHQLQFLHLENNRIATIRANTFDETQMNNLQFLHLDNNLITDIPNLAFNRLRLIVLTLSNNRIATIEKLSLPPTLGYLDLRNNLISQIPYLALKDVTNLKALNLEGNNITKLETDLEVIFKNELKLVLRNNKIKRLSNGSFKSFQKFTELDLSYNQIHTIAPMVFDGIGQIKELDLSYNRLAYIPDGVFVNLAKTINKLNLEENILHTLPKAMGELRELTHLNLCGNKLNKIENFAILGSKRTLLELRLAYNHLREVPTDVLTGMERLQQLDLSKNKIETLEKLAFGTFDGTGTSLMFLNLAGNQIKVINDPAVFLYMSSLAYLDLSLNQIKLIGEQAFDKLPALETLFLQNNKLTTFPVNALAKMQKLRNLVLDGNHLTTLPDYFLGQLIKIERFSMSRNDLSIVGEKTFHPSSNRELKLINLENNAIIILQSRAFAQLENLQQILLSGNRLQALESFSFVDMRNLKQIDLTGNQIVVISSYTFVNLPQLERLSLSHNYIDNMERDIFSKVPKIEYLDLSHNKLKRLTCDQLSHINTIHHLNIARNELNSIDLTCVKRSLQSLDLAFNELQTLPKEVMQDFDELKNLSLRHNGILEIPGHAFSTCQKLEYLDLAKNHIRYIWKGTFSNQKRFKRIDLSSNVLEGLQHGVFGRDNVYELDLSENEIQKVPINALETIANSLSYLNLKRNKIGSIDASQFIGLKNLSTLILSDNVIESIEIAAFEHLPSLRFLDLSHNPITTWHPQAFAELSHSISLLNLADTGLFSVPKVSHRSLRHLNISHNKIYDIQKKDLAPFAKLDTLDISYNNVHALDSNLFVDLTGLKELNISGNKITQLTKEQFKNLHQLEVLYASSLPSLTKLPDPDAYAHLAHLKELVLLNLPNAVRNYNVSLMLGYLPPLRILRIEIKEEVLDTQLRKADLRMLRELSVTGNRLKHIAVGALEGLRGLHFHLQIYDSALESFPSSLFNTLSGIHFLALSLPNNRITTIDPFKFSQLPIINQHGTVLKSIYLRDNPLRCDCGLYWISGWIKHIQSLKGSLNVEIDILTLGETYCRGNPSSLSLFEMQL
ncbi:unnamed protein product, partial [Mesorhabditis belari]|uniref:Chaoptin n=1 Tax=Mesorhabditis belari TaxID=2138241 RepID=A0AAF3J4A8_9BILA